MGVKLLLSSKRVRFLCSIIGEDAFMELCNTHSRFAPLVKAYMSESYRMFYSIDWVALGDFSYEFGVPMESLVLEEHYIRKSGGFVMHRIVCEAYRKGYRRFTDLAPEEMKKKYPVEEKLEQKLKEVILGKNSLFKLNRLKYIREIIFDRLRSDWTLIVPKRRREAGLSEEEGVLSLAMSRMSEAGAAAMCGVALLFADEGVSEDEAVDTFRKLWRFVRENSGPREGALRKKRKA